MSDLEKQQLAQKVMDAVKSGSVSMRPRFFFAVRGLLLSLAIFGALFAALFFFSYLLFALEKSGALALPAFGWEGTRRLLAVFPWFMTLFAVGLGLLFAALVQRYSPTYRLPFFFSLLGVAAFLVAFVGITRQFSLHPRLAGYATKRHVPLVEDMYRGSARMPMRDVYLGTAEELTEQSLVLRLDDETKLFVSFGINVHLPCGAVQSGDRVVIMGNVADGMLSAVGIRRLQGPCPRGARMRRVPVPLDGARSMEPPPAPFPVQ